MEQFAFANCETKCKDCELPIIQDNKQILKTNYKNSCHSEALAEESHNLLRMSFIQNLEMFRFAQHDEMCHAELISASHELKSFNILTLTPNPSPKREGNRCAFTLAEVLITLVIIGVIAAITVPNMIHSYQEQKRTAKIRKVFSLLSNAMTYVKANGGDTNFDILDNNSIYTQNWYDNYLKKYLSTTKVCINTTGCWSNELTKKLNNSGTYPYAYNGKCGLVAINAILLDGTYLAIDGFSQSGIKSYFGVDVSKDSFIMAYDINGEKGPNTMGKDVFFAVYKDGTLVPACKDRTNSQINNDCSSSGEGYCCIMKYLQNQ